MDDSWNEEERGPKQALIKEPTQTIWKFQIPVLEEFTVDIPGGGVPIRFDNQGGKLWMWAICSPGQPTKPLRFRAFKTGAEMPVDSPMSYVGCAAIYIQAELMLYYFLDLESEGCMLNTERLTST